MKLIISTAPPDEAQRLAHTLVEERWVACVNIVPKIQSIYHWDGDICNDTECILFMKTTDDTAASAMTRIRELHSYDVPEIICLPIEEAGSNPDYLNWIGDSVQKR